MSRHRRGGYAANSIVSIGSEDCNEQGVRMGGIADLRRRERDRAVDFASRAVLAVVQQRLLFSETEPGRYRLSDAELTRRLGGLFLAVVRNP
jgi:hypothetical protein